MRRRELQRDGGRRPEIGGGANTGGRSVRRTTGRRAAILAVALLALSQAGCGGSAETKDPEPRLVKAVTASLDTLVVTVNAWGVAEANRRVELAFEVQGTIESLPYDEGERAPKGAVLGSLRQGRFESSYTSAKASFEDAERNAARMVKLSEESVISDEERERAETALAAAQARLRSAEEDLRGSVITAPFRGTVTKRFCEQGQVIPPGAPAFVFMEMNPILVKIDLSDADVARVTDGQRAAVRFDAYPGRVFDGAVSKVGAAADEQGGAFEVEIAIPNSDDAVKPGMAAEAQIDVEVLSRVIVLPVEALVYEAGVPHVYVVSGGVAAKRGLEIAGQSGMEVAVRGLAPGDTVVSAGNRFLKDGEPVRAVVGR
jgi:RND family efflux transporter MFP subunit